MTENNTTHPAVLRTAESLTFFGITGCGALQQRELYRFMEGTGPQWWLPVSGMTREQFWTTKRCALMARSTTVRVLAAGCRPSEKVTVEHEIRHGRRDRPGRDPEYGFVDTLRVCRDADRAVLADLTSHTVWIDYRDGVPKIADAPPGGLDCPLEELPALTPLPALGEPLATMTFRWTARECDVTNDHVSFPSYLERAENALADAGIPVPDQQVWQGWYRHQFVDADETTVATTRDGDSIVFGFQRERERRPRVVLRLTGAGS